MQTVEDASLAAGATARHVWPPAPPLDPACEYRCEMAMVHSAGVLLFRVTASERVEVLLGHMGGPFHAHRDDGAWSIPKGEYDADEDSRVAAAREFEEELGAPLPAGRQIELGTIRLPSGKRLVVYAVESDFDARQARSNTFELEWPPGSGRIHSFPEIDRAQWFDCATARVKLARGQAEFLDRLLAALCDDEAG